METSALHLGLISDMKRLNSLFCAISYAVLDNPEAPLSARDEDDIDPQRDVEVAYPPEITSHR